MKKNEIIGWIGTGLMGYPMAARLLKEGYQVNIHTRTKVKAEPLIGMGGTWYDTPAALAASADVIVTIIGSPREIEDCYFEEQGILCGIKRGAVMIDMTTTKPGLAVKIAAHAGRLDAHFIDAPVSGGVTGAVNGALSIMLGGEKEIVERMMPLFEVLGKNIVYQGTAGSGQHTKMCNQITLAISLLGVCEGLIYSIKAGLDPNKVLQSVSKGAAGCWSLDILAPKMIQGDYSPGFTVDNFLKDLTIALEEAARMQLSLPGLALVKQLYMVVKAMGKGHSGNQALYLALERLSSMKKH